MAIIGKRNLNNLGIVEVDSDPRVSINENYNKGSVALWDEGSVGVAFLKTGDSINDWALLGQDDLLSTYLTSPSLDIPTSPITIPFNVVRLNSNINVFNPNTITGEVEVLRGGNYLINTDIGIIKSGGNNRVSIDSWIEINGIEQPVTRAHANVSSNGSLGSSTISVIPFNLSANDVIRIRVEKTFGTQSVDLDVVSCRLKITKVIT